MKLKEIIAKAHEYNLEIGKTMNGPRIDSEWVVMDQQGHHLESIDQTRYIGFDKDAEYYFALSAKRQKQVGKIVQMISDYAQGQPYQCYRGAGI